eukprot:gene18141-23795_t
MANLIIYGSVNDDDLYFSLHVANRIKEKFKDVTIKFHALSEIEYLIKLEEFKSSNGGLYHSHTAPHLVIKDGVYIGDLKNFFTVAIKEYGIDDITIASRGTFGRQSKEDTTKILQADENKKFVYLDFLDGSDEKKSHAPIFGRVIIELFTDLCPVACQNFITLCNGIKSPDGTKLFYGNCPIHRLVKNGWFQCGDVIDGSGSHNSVAISLPDNQIYIQDESFTVDFGFPLGGIVGLSNQGPHTNGSQFFITLGPSDWMNCKYVGIGKVIFGYKVLKAINNAPIKNQRPYPPIIVKSCGLEV